MLPAVESTPIRYLPSKVTANINHYQPLHCWLLTPLNPYKPLKTYPSWLLLPVAMTPWGNISRLSRSFREHSCTTAIAADVAESWVSHDSETTRPRELQEKEPTNAGYGQEMGKIDKKCE